MHVVAEVPVMRGRYRYLSVIPGFQRVTHIHRCRIHSIENETEREDKGDE